MLAQEELFMIKGKRSKRARPIAPSSSTTAELSGGFVTESDPVAASSPSNYSGEFIQTKNDDEEEEQDLANCLLLLAKGHYQMSSQPLASHDIKTASMVEIYLCKTCNKSFSSFQALGGHRASHRKPILGPEENKYKQELQSDSTILSLKISNNGILGCSLRNKSKVHECSICGAEFSSGQALGGHMRRHSRMRPIPTSSHGESREVKKPRAVLSLDLNLPAPEEDNSRESKFPFSIKEQVIVFSSSPLVDCHF